MSEPQTRSNIDESLIQEITRRVLSVARPEKIILFGSAATGKMSPDSDIDLLVVEPSDRDRLEETDLIDEVLTQLNWPFDVVVMSSEWFHRTKDVVGGIAYPARKHGRVIYESA